jgi:hypothetical protein
VLYSFRVLQFGSAFGNGHGLSAELMGSSSSVILVANKVDQVEDRMVTIEEGIIKLTMRPHASYSLMVTTIGFSVLIEIFFNNVLLFFIH